MSYLFRIIILLFIIFYSCKGNRNDFKPIPCVVENSIDILPDSTFMSDAIKMQIKNNHIYFIESSSRQLIKLSKDFSINKRIGQWGIGPQDLTEPRNFSHINDTLFVMDVGNMSIKYFLSDSIYVNGFKMEAFSEERVFTHKNYLYIASYNREFKTCMSQLDLSNKKEITQFGESFDFKNSLQNIIRNKRNLLKDNEYFYAISDNQPIIEKYDLENNEKIESYNYSFVPLIQRNIDAINSKPQKPNSYTAFVRDSYISDGKIYILLSSREGQFKANKILCIKLNPDFELGGIYSLPGNIYSSFYVSDDSFFAFNSETASIEKINMDKH